MRRLIAAIVLIFGLTSLALAGTYSVTTTAAQDTKIGRLRAFANASNLFGAPHATDLAFVNAMCKQRLSEVEDAARAANPTWDTALAAATPAQKDAACVAVGAAAGCLP